MAIFKALEEFYEENNKRMIAFSRPVFEINGEKYYLLPIDPIPVPHIPPLKKHGLKISLQGITDEQPQVDQQPKSE